jgi:hypothetical protein
MDLLKKSILDTIDQNPNCKAKFVINTLKVDQWEEHIISGTLAEMVNDGWLNFSNERTLTVHRDPHGLCVRADDIIPHIEALKKSVRWDPEMKVILEVNRSVIAQLYPGMQCDLADNGVTIRQRTIQEEDLYEA